jgi:hypothetical protein
MQKISKRVVSHQKYSIKEWCIKLIKQLMVIIFPMLFLSINAMEYKNLTQNENDTSKKELKKKITFEVDEDEAPFLKDFLEKQKEELKNQEVQKKLKLEQEEFDKKTTGKRSVI